MNDEYFIPKENFTGDKPRGRPFAGESKVVSVRLDKRVYNDLLLISGMYGRDVNKWLGYLVIAYSMLIKETNGIPPKIDDKQFFERLLSKLYDRPGIDKRQPLRDIDNLMEQYPDFRTLYCCPDIRAHFPKLDNDDTV